MSQHVLIALGMPPDLEKCKLSHGVNERLHALLDRQDRGAGLTAAERTEAAGTVADTKSVAGRVAWAMRSIPAELRRLVVQRAAGAASTVSGGPHRLIQGQLGHHEHREGHHDLARMRRRGGGIGRRAAI
jgi:hypothetical protein